MARTFVLRYWLASRPLSGRIAFLVGLCAIAVPTMFRLAVDGYVSGLTVATYVPFILLSAVLLGWWHASIVTLVSAIAVDDLFVGPSQRLFEGPADFFVLGIFLFVAGVIIGFVELVRRMVRDKPGEDEKQSGIIFSEEEGHAWASRPGLGAPVRLGPEEEVAEMMEDYLAQRKLAERLSKAATKK